MNKEECLNALDDLLMDAWEYRDHLMKVAKNESWSVIHDAPKGLIAMSVNLAIRTCDRFTFRINESIDCINRNIATEYDGLVEVYTAQMEMNVRRYNSVLEQIGAHTIVLTHRARFRKSYVRS